ncbi:hypothetical protein LTR16_005497, partial [Cryomyces antarcticus]
AAEILSESVSLTSSISSTMLTIADACMTRSVDEFAPLNELMDVYTVPSDCAIMLGIRATDAPLPMEVTAYESWLSLRSVLMAGTLPLTAPCFDMSIPAWYMTLVSFVIADEHGILFGSEGTLSNGRSDMLRESITNVSSRALTHLPSIMPILMNPYGPANPCLLMIVLTIPFSDLTTRDVQYDFETKILYICFHDFVFSIMLSYIFPPLCVDISSNVIVVSIAGPTLSGILFLFATECTGSKTLGIVFECQTLI